MYIWLYWENRPGKVIPPYIELCHETIRRHCSDDFEVVLTTPETIRNYIPDAGEFEKIRNPNPAIRAAYIRVALLAKYGGIWMDSDIIVMKSFDPMKELIEKHDFVCFHKNSAGDNHIPNWIFMSTPGSKVITEYKRRIDNAIKKKKAFPWGQLGARMISPIVRNWADEDDRIILPERLVSPIPWQKKRLFFTARDPSAYIREDTLSCLLWNNQFSEAFKLYSRETVLDSGILMAKLFKQSLGI